jgi:hypothetical protein
VRATENANAATANAKHKREPTLSRRNDLLVNGLRACDVTHISSGKFPRDVNSNNFADELQIHREFLRALGKEDVKHGETLRAVAIRVFEAWLTGPFACRSYGPPFYVPAFDRTSQKFDPEFGFTIGDAPFEEFWTPPSDCTGDELIDIAALPKLLKLSKANPKTLEAKVEPATPPTQAPPAPIPQQQPDAINFTWIPSDTQRYLNGGRS